MLYKIINDETLDMRYEIEGHVVREASLLLINFAGEVHSCAAVHYLEHGYGYHSKSKRNAAKANGRHL